MLCPRPFSAAVPCRRACEFPAAASAFRLPECPSMGVYRTVESSRRVSFNPILVSVVESGQTTRSLERTGPMLRSPSAVTQKALPSRPADQLPVDDLDSAWIALIRTGLDDEEVAVDCCQRRCPKCRRVRRTIPSSGSKPNTVPCASPVQMSQWCPLRSMRRQWIDRGPSARTSC